MDDLFNLFNKDVINAAAKLGQSDTLYHPGRVYLNQIVLRYLNDDYLIEKFSQWYKSYNDVTLVSDSNLKQFGFFVVFGNESDSESIQSRFKKFIEQEDFSCAMPDFLVRMKILHCIKHDIYTK